MTKKTSFPMVSVVIPSSHKDPEVIKKCLNSIMAQNYPKEKFEVIVIRDFLDDISRFMQRYPLKVITANLRPGAKRNRGVEVSRGEIIVFCDDDIIAPSEWLHNLITNFNFTEFKVAVVGGPNLTPQGSSLRERCSGYVFSSFLGGGQMFTRYKSTGGEVREASETDLISCNMAVRKKVLQEVGGFPEKLFPNEENVLLNKIKKAGYKLIYASSAVVWHKRRPIFIPHAKQVFQYGRGRGQMTRMYPDSLKPTHLISSVFVFFLVAGGLLSFFSDFILLLFGIGILAYAVATIITSAKIAIEEQTPQILFLLPLAFFLTHCAYGLGFLRGILAGSRALS